MSTKNERNETKMSVTVIEWLLEECKRRLAIEKDDAPEPPGKTFVAQIDDLPGRGFNDTAAEREYQKRRYRTGKSE